MEVFYGTRTSTRTPAAGNHAGTAPANTNVCRYHSIWFDYFGIPRWSIDPDRKKREISYNAQVKLTGQTGGFRDSTAVRKASGLFFVMRHTATAYRRYGAAVSNLRPEGERGVDEVSLVQGSCCCWLWLIWFCRSVRFVWDSALP